MKLATASQTFMYQTNDSHYDEFPALFPSHRVIVVPEVPKNDVVNHITSRDGLAAQNRYRLLSYFVVAA